MKSERYWRVCTFLSKKNVRRFCAGKGWWSMGEESKEDHGGPINVKHVATLDHAQLVS